MPSHCTIIRAALVIGALTSLAFGGPVAAASSPTDLPALEQAWHGCVRGAYDLQPEQQSRSGRERSALGECKAHEDAYVAALMAARAADGDGLEAAWARTWAAYVAYVVDPVASWIGALKR